VKHNQTADSHAKEKNNDNHLPVDFHSPSPFFSVSNPWSLPILPLQHQMVTGGVHEVIYFCDYWTAFAPHPRSSATAFWPE
jgi:hypothetical protein